VNLTKRQFVTAAAGTAAAAVVGIPPVSASARTRPPRTLFIRSALAVDTAAATVILPLHRGRCDGRVVWYVVTESSDPMDARRRAVNLSTPMAHALGTRAVQRAHLVDRVVHFEGTVDFSPTRRVMPGPTGFPPAQFAPGAVGDARYSPLVTLDRRVVLNATHVANSSGHHDSIVHVDYRRRRVTMAMFNGFVDGHRIQYLHQEASSALVAALEGSTFTPNLDFAPGYHDDQAPHSAREEIIPIINGALGVHDPHRQGLQSALLGQGDPLNIATGSPTEPTYSPIWDIHPALWTPAAIHAGHRRRLTRDVDVAAAVRAGQLVSAGTGPVNHDLGGLRALPGISMCPIVVRLAG